LSALQFTNRTAPICAIEDVHAGVCAEEPADGYAITAGVELAPVEAKRINAIGCAGQAELPVPVTVSRRSEQRTRGEKGKANKKQAWVDQS